MSSQIDHLLNETRRFSPSPEFAADAVATAVATALESGQPAVTFTDVKGNTFIVPTAGIAFVEVGTEESRRVGFVA